MAWLGAVPKPPEGSSRAKMNLPGSKMTRLERMKKDGIEPKMPPNPMPHLITRLVEIGLTEATGMGAAPLSWREICEWQRATAIELEPWEAELMRSLSVTYIAESIKAESENYPAPFRAEVTQRDREIEESELYMVLG